MISNFSDALDKVSELGNEVITDPHQIAELGSVKPKEYGSLMKKKLAEQRLSRQTESLFTKELISGDAADAAYLRGDLSGAGLEGVRQDYSSEELAQETADRLFDSGVTAENWERASHEERERMFESAAEIMEKEMRISPGQVSAFLGTEDLSVRDFAARIGESVSGEERRLLTGQALSESDYTSSMTMLFFGLSKISRSLRESGLSAIGAETGIMGAERIALYDPQAYLDTAYFKKSLKDGGSN